jgi:dTMP kinase
VIVAVKSAWKRSPSRETDGSNSSKIPVLVLLPTGRELQSTRGHPNGQTSSVRPANSGPLEDPCFPPCPMEHTWHWSNPMIIALEGIDGSGKNTQAQLLQARLRNAGLTTDLFSFPRYGQTFFATSITDYLNGEFGSLSSVDPHFAALLYAGDRFETKASLLSALSQHDVIVCDRYVASNLAHQGARVPAPSRRAFLEWTANLEHEVYGLPRAQLTLYLDIPSEVASTLIQARPRRTSATAQADIHESDTLYLERCREVYRMLANQNFRSTWQTVSCMDDAGRLRDPSSIAQSVWDLLQSVIPSCSRLRQPS